MKRAALVLAVAAAGCYYDRPNPWDTSSDVDAYEESREELLHMETLVPHHPDQQPAARFTDPDLEAWRDTVLAAADDESLARIHASTAAKIAHLKGRIEEYWRIDPHNRKIPLTELVWKLRVEELRLSMVESRIRAGAPRRAG